MLRKGSSIPYKLAATLFVGTLFVLVWANLAVGLIGSEGNPANLMYLAVLLTGIAGAFVVRFQAKGIAKLLCLCALIQAIIAVIAIVLGLGKTASGPAELVMVNGLFIVLFLISAYLFYKSS